MLQFVLPSWSPAVSGGEWVRVLLAMAILAALFVFPIVTLWRDERRKRRSSEGREDAMKD